MLDQLPDTENSGPEKRKASATVARPFHELVRVMIPSTGPVLQGNSIAARTRLYRP